MIVEVFGPPGAGKTAVLGKLSESFPESCFNPPSRASLAFRAFAPQMILFLSRSITKVALTRHSSRKDKWWAITRWARKTSRLYAMRRSGWSGFIDSGPLQAVWSTGHGATDFDPKTLVGNLATSQCAPDFAILVSAHTLNVERRIRNRPSQHSRINIDSPTEAIHRSVELAERIAHYWPVERLYVARNDGDICKCARLISNLPQLQTLKPTSD